MKLLLIISLVIAVSSHTVDEIQKARSECYSELEISEDLIQKYKKFEFPDEHKTHCYIRCANLKLHLFDDEHGFKVDEIVNLFESAHAENVQSFKGDVQKCIDDLENHDEDKCTWAYKTYMCFLSHHAALIRKHTVKN
uniref:Proteinral odorant-binding protein 99a obp n=1 Tax=Corethrella appendiculata TaxID=1370023 RepID=U5EUS9_9DIPT